METAENKPQEEFVFDIELFKKQFIHVTRTGFGVKCDAFEEGANKCKSEKDFYYLFRRFKEDVGANIGVKDNSDEVRELQDEIESLQARVSELEKYENMSDSYIQFIDSGAMSVLDEMKVKIFFDNINLFSLDEIEQMMNVYQLK